MAHNMLEIINKFTMAPKYHLNEFNYSKKEQSHNFSDEFEFCSAVEAILCSRFPFIKKPIEYVYADSTIIKC